MFGNDRGQIRRCFHDVWRRHNAGQALEPLEQLIAAVIGQHPQYHPLLADLETALARDYPVEAGETNPFLHMGMHIAVQEQLGADRPPGIQAIYRRLCQRCPDRHAAEHRMMDCLGEILWEAQRNGTAPDETAYLQRLRQLLRGG
ncbi:MAG: DUF1841 family protein [Pseudomonadota bacterium]|nr:DUF1841 family protein [Pseudomonadota bacterium]